MHQTIACIVLTSSLVKIELVTTSSCF